jgi:hypothetical protein
VAMQSRTFMKKFAFLVLITAVVTNAELFLVIPIREWEDAQAAHIIGTATR